MFKLSSAQNNKYGVQKLLYIRIYSPVKLQKYFPLSFKKMKYFLCYVISLSVFREILT